MSSDKTQDANPEQLLKLLAAEMTVARERRSAREAGRHKAGTIGLFIIIGGAALAFWVLTLLLDQMRPRQAERRANAPVNTSTDATPNPR